LCLPAFISIIASADICLCVKRASDRNETDKNLFFVPI
jgi:hypothetical protein